MRYMTGENLSLCKRSFSFQCLNCIIGLKEEIFSVIWNFAILAA